MKTCLFCGAYSGRCTFCKKCKAEKNRAGALLSQNVTKLQKLLNSKRLTTFGFEKFMFYVDKIISNGKVIMKYKTANEYRNLIVIQNYKIKK